MTTPNVQSKKPGCEFTKYSVYMLLRRFPKTKIQENGRKKFFWLIKNKDKIVGNHLKLFF